MSAKLYVNKQNIKYNLEQIKNYLNNDTKIIAMVKANAYGTGAKEICKYLETIGITDFGVALVSEGVYLRECGINSNILVTSQYLAEDIDNILDYNLSVSVSNTQLLEILNEKAFNKHKKVKIHIKVDTGMSRLGFSPNNIVDIVTKIKENYKNIILEGIYTHLSCADSNREYTLKQLMTFDNIVKKLQEKNIFFPYVHALNSAGVISYSDYAYTHVRVGIAMYGYLPSQSLSQKIKLKNSCKLTAPIIHLHNIKKSDLVSYSGTFIASKDMRIATLQIGYADGLRRQLSNNYSLYLKGSLCNIVGNICMDMCMIDISNLEDVKVGDEVEIFGPNLDILNMEKALNTINYEILSTLSSRIERIYF